MFSLFLELETGVKIEFDKEDKERLYLLNLLRLELLLLYILLVPVNPYFLFDISLSLSLL